MVFDDEDTNLGELTEIIQSGASDVYVMKNGKKTTMAPALKSVILDIDIDKRTILMSRERLEEVAVYED